VQRYYESHPQEFLRPSKVIFRHLLLANAKHNGEEQTYALAETIYTEIATQKISFAQAAKKYSDDESSSAAGGLEELVTPDSEREAWLADVRAAASEQPRGELGPILVSPRGCHLAELIAVKEPEKIPYSEAQKTIVAKMEQEKWETSANKLYAQLSREISVEILAPRFPDHYRWANSQAVKTRRIGVR
jgi:parvulin-like peptidyl-prolyl isomerase